jgi:ABC-2 type transport system ATP-binding protein
MHTTPTRPVIRATGLRKSFGGTVVPDGVDLDVPERTVLAVLGPNWAGKTSIVRILHPHPRGRRSGLQVARVDTSRRHVELAPPLFSVTMYQ